MVWYVLKETDDSIFISYFSSILDPIVKDQGRLNMVSSSPTPITGSLPVGE